MHMMNNPSAEVLRVIEDAWSELQRSPYVQLQLGATPARLVDLSYFEAVRRSEQGRALLERIAKIDDAGLPHELVLTLRLVKYRAEMWQREAGWYWSVVDPMGIGYFGLFLPTAYCGGFLLTTIHAQLAVFQFSAAGDTDRYLGLIADYALLIEQFAHRTEGQAERGILMPKAQVMQARALLVGLRSGSALAVASERLNGTFAAQFALELGHRIEAFVQPAFDRALSVLSDAYLLRAPEDVGMSRIPGGLAVYDELVRFHTTLDLSPGEIHKRGIGRMQQIHASMLAIRQKLGFDDDAAAFVEHINQDAAWHADSVEGVTAVFQRYIDRFNEAAPRYFDHGPKAKCSVAPLPTAQQGSMTYGFYDAPRRHRPEGRYLFNAANLTSQALYHVAALTYHELMPGHHMHLASQMENETLHAFRAHSFVNAYNEGWAEYAAALADEMGLYQKPEERYGRLVMDAFLTSRLVVDTGMNALGWSLEQARQYMRSNTAMTEREIQTESVRYSCDIPAQSLAYKLGDTFIYSLRAELSAAMGDSFDVRNFHRAVLETGALPLLDMRWHVNARMMGRFSNEG